MLVYLRLDLAGMGGAIGQRRVGLWAGDDLIADWVIRTAGLVDPHHDFPDVGPADYPGSPAEWTVAEGDHGDTVARGRAGRPRLSGVNPDQRGQSDS